MRATGSHRVAGYYLTFVLACMALGPSTAWAEELRAFWVDAWGSGFHNQSEVEQLLGQVGSSTNIGDIREANCNAVFVQVRRRADTCYPSALGEPYMSGLSPSNFNALQAIIDAAHDTTGGKQRIEVHCWIVAFKTRSDSPLYYAHNNPGDPDNYWITRYDDGSEPADKPLDPGHPRAAEYLTDVCMDLVNNFDIDGLHYDYIRFAANNEGYNPTSVARFNEQYGQIGQPAASDADFKQWRRDQITAFVRRVYAHVQRDRPQVKVSAAVVTWNPSPTSSTRAAFMNTRPYFDVYCDWDAWMEEGILDMNLPMTYYNQTSLPADYERWLNFQKDRKFDRHNVVGPGIYLNSRSDALLQLEMTRDPSPAGNYADGFCGYSYRVPYSGGSWSGFEPYLVSQVTPTPDDVPDMPWKSLPTKGHIMGTVTYAASGDWADAASVSITGPETRNMICDGTGFFAFIDLPPGSYTVTAGDDGYSDSIANVSVSAGIMSEQDFQLGNDPLPQISNVQASNITDTAATITWYTNQLATSQVEYGPTDAYGQSSPLNGSLVTNHSVTLSGLSASQLYHYRVLSTNANGTSTSSDFTFNTEGPPQISNVQASTITTDSATITWTTSAPSTSLVRYGLTSAYGEQTALDPTLVTEHAVTILGLTPETLYHYQVVSDNGYGSDESTDYTFNTAAFVADIVIDNTDPGWANTSPGGGTWSSGSIPAVPKIGDSYLYATGVGDTDETAATHTCTWTPNITVAGRYDVYVFYQIGANRTSGAPYRVVYDGGTITSIQNQYSSTPNQGDWFLVGSELPFEAGTSGYVQLGNNTADTDLVSADAARFVYKSGLDQTPPTTPIVVDDGDSTGNREQLNASWTTQDPETGILHSEYRILDQGGAVVRNWTNVGSAMAVTAAGLSLVDGETYVFEVRAVNTVQMISGIGASDGITVFAFDINNDGMVNNTDLTAILDCMSGPNQPYPSDPAMECDRFDPDSDGDVDQADFGAFQKCSSGNFSLDVNCLD
jgi:uncharacterized lipoprotein YddW (UPF0748 family)